MGENTEDSKLIHEFCDGFSESNFPTSSDNEFMDSGSVINTLNRINKNDEEIIKQFAANEDNKRTLKPKILIWVCAFIIIQLVIMNLILFIVILSLVVGESTLWFIHSINLKIVPDVFDFLKYYITATIVELLGMLYFMIRKVFDNSIVDFFKLNRRLKDKIKKTKNKDNN